MTKCSRCGTGHITSDRRCSSCGARAAGYRGAHDAESPPRAKPRPKLVNPASKTKTADAPAANAAKPARKKVTVRVPVAKPPADGPHARLRLRARPEFSSVPGNEAPLMGVLVEIDAEGQPIVDRDAGPVAHVILVLDLSASMDRPDKYPVLRRAVFRMLRDLRRPDAANVLVSVIGFAMGARVFAEGISGRDLDPAALFRVVQQHKGIFGRYTDLAGGLRAAGRIARKWCEASRTMPVRVCLLTDGRPQDVPLALRVTEAVATLPCDLDCLAFGADADVTLLQELFAGRRGGTVKSVRSASLGAAFERIAEVAQHVVARRCLVSVDLAPGVVGGAAFRHRPARVRFPEPAFVSGKAFRADLGTIETGRTYSLLFEVRPPETDGATTHIGDLTVQIPGWGGPITETLAIDIPRTGVAALPDPDRDVREARDILDAIDDTDPDAALRALRLRRTLYERERRDPGLLDLLDRAIALMETEGSLASLTTGERATLRAHTCTASAEDAEVLADAV